MNYIKISLKKNASNNKKYNYDINKKNSKKTKNSLLFPPCKKAINKKSKSIIKKDEGRIKNKLIKTRSVKYINPI